MIYCLFSVLILHLFQNQLAFAARCCFRSYLSHHVRVLHVSQQLQTPDPEGSSRTLTCSQTIRGGHATLFLFFILTLTSLDKYPPPPTHTHNVVAMRFKLIQDISVCMLLLAPPTGQNNNDDLFNQAALDGQTVVSSGALRDRADLKRVLLRTPEGSLKVLLMLRTRESPQALLQTMTFVLKHLGPPHIPP